MNKIHSIGVHPSPHLDELLAAWLLKKFGEKVFPGIGEAKIICVGTGTVDSLAALAQGIVHVGIGHGVFDEHQKGKGGGRAEDECAATLVAKHLGIAELPRLRLLLRGALEADQRAQGPLQEFAATLKTINRYSALSLDPNKVYEWAAVAFDAMLARQDEYLEALKIARKCHRTSVSGVTIFVTDKVDNVQFATACRNEVHGPVVIIQRSGRGNMQIFCRGGVPMAEIAGAIRVAEWRARGHNDRVPCKQLQAEGYVNGVPQWYFGGDSLLNGSESYPNVEPTRLDVKDAYEAVCGTLRRVRQQKPATASVVPAA